MNTIVHGICCFLITCSLAVAGDLATLRDAAGGKFLIGTIVNTGIADHPDQAALVASQFDAITAENQFKPAMLQPRRGVFDFSGADPIARFAAAHHQALIGHTLLWHSQAPLWMFQAADGSPLPRAAGLAHLKNHIDTVMGHFRGKVLGWDVVNEAIDDGPAYLRDTPARQSIGDDYIIRAFEFAHAADPAAELYYNDYGIEQGAKLTKVLRLIHDLQQAGVHLHAVGIQGHWSMDWPPISDIEHGLTAIAATGVRVQITELDIDMLPRKGRTANIADIENGNLSLEVNPYANSLPDRLLSQQADRYGQIFKVFVTHRDVIERVSFWGFYDGSSWLNNYPVKGRTNYPLPFDRQLKPKPAFYSVLAALQNSGQ